MKELPILLKKWHNKSKLDFSRRYSLDRVHSAGIRNSRGVDGTRDTAQEVTKFIRNNLYYSKYLSHSPFLFSHRNELYIWWHLYLQDNHDGHGAP